MHSSGFITNTLTNRGSCDRETDGHIDGRIKSINEVITPTQWCHYHFHKRILNINKRTLLLWSLTLMMRSFLRRSQTEARPLGLAEARMCCTWRFHATQLMSSRGYGGKCSTPNRLDAYNNILQNSASVCLCERVWDCVSMSLCVWACEKERADTRYIPL